MRHKKPAPYTITLLCLTVLLSCATKPPPPVATEPQPEKPKQTEQASQPGTASATSQTAPTTQETAPGTQAPTTTTTIAPSAKAPPLAVEESSFRPGALGFSPTASDSRFKEIRFALNIGNKPFVKSWRLDIQSMEGVARGFSGGLNELQPVIAWDGRKDSGDASPEGYYTATLGVEYEAGLAPVVRSVKFYLALSPPQPRISADLPRFVPTPTGVQDPLRFTLAGAPALARIDSWKLDVTDPKGALVKTWNGSWPPTDVEWDGKTEDGGLVEPSTRYSALYSIFDEFGHAGKASLGIPVAALEPPLDKGAIRPASSGFSPNHDGLMDSMEFYVRFGYADILKSWRVIIVHPENGRVRRIEGPSGDLPRSVLWDGVNDAGVAVPEGRYYAMLESEYGRAAAPASTMSASFILAKNPPVASLFIAPWLFSPDGDGLADELHIVLSAKERFAELASWSIAVKSPEGGPFATFSGEWPPREILWDGTSESGEGIQSAEIYPVEAYVVDEFGNRGSVESVARTDILVVKEGEGYRINVASILFKPYTADFKDVPPDRAARNIDTLDRLAVRLARFPDYKVRLVGHAVMEEWDDPDLGAIEQEVELLPLSASRAEAVAAALVERGLHPSMFVTEGVGANDQVVPDWDLENRYRNRRVVFFLERN